MMRRVTKSATSFDPTQIEALGAPPPPPLPATERVHSGRITGVTIWTPLYRDRLRRAYRIGGEPAVIAAFPGWTLGSLQTAIVRYALGPDAGVKPVSFNRQQFEQRLAQIPPPDLFERVKSLMRSRL